MNRKSSPKVRDGRVQKKNRHGLTRLNSLSVGVEGGGKGRRVLTKEDVWKFLRLVPDWKRVSTHLDLIYLATSDEIEADGEYWLSDQRITLAPWSNDLTMSIDRVAYLEAHGEIFKRLGVPVEETETGWIARFDEESARAWQLLHIFLHELGHHHYRITKGRGKSAGDEKYAETYALKLEREIWPRYCEAFKFKPRSIT
jgi:hypothetical protein